MNLHRFLAYTVLACWIGLTGVVIGTALQWSAANAMSDVKVQRALNAQKDANSGQATAVSGSANGATADPDAIARLQSQNDRAVAKAEVASEAMGDALNFELAERKQFWWELGVWGTLTLLASALLAERRDIDEKPSTHK